MNIKITLTPGEIESRVRESIAAQYGLDIDDLTFKLDDCFSNKATYGDNRPTQ